MRLLGKPLLVELIRVYPRSRAWTSSWASEIKDAHWKQPADVRRQFPNAGELLPDEFAFPVAECPIAILLKIAFPQSVAVIKQLLGKDRPYGY